jgi:hypothetical protein
MDPGNCGRVLVIWPVALAPSANVVLSIPQTAWAGNGVPPPPPVLLELRTSDKVVGLADVLDKVCLSLLFHEGTAADAEVVLVLVSDTLDAALTPGVVLVSSHMAKLLAADPVKAYVARQLGSLKATPASSRNVLAAVLTRLTVVVADPLEFRKWSPRRQRARTVGTAGDVAARILKKN